ncbi:MAG: hypothetical protein HRT72_00020 [Flavobacteriales bacterium]|nr:hypothetical protein [Flavobacteriales bacterium]
MKNSLIFITLLICVCACKQEPNNKKKLVEYCIYTIQNTGNVNEASAIRYCKCSADTLITIFSLNDLEKHMDMDDKDRYKLYLPYTSHCMSELANTGSIDTE